MKCCDLNSGKLRHKILLEREEKVKDNTGGFTSTWVTHKTLYAHIEPLTGMTNRGEVFHASKLEARISHRIHIRYFTDIKETDRLNYNGRYMQIRKILNMEERNQWIELHAEEGAVN